MRYSCRRRWRATVGLLLAVAAVVLGGCWDWRELDTLAIVAGAGVDLAGRPGQVLLTIQAIRPAEIREVGGGGMMGSSGGTRVPPVRVLTSTGATVDQAVRNCITKTSRQLYFPHSQILVLGRDAARKGVYPLLDFFVRDPEARPTTWVLVARNQASEILSNRDAVERVDAIGISRAVRRSAENGFVPATTIQDFTERLMSRTTAPVAPRLEIYEEKEITGEKTRRVRPGGTAVFKGDRLVGELNLQETRGMLWVLGRVKTGIISITSPGGKESLEIRRASRRIIPRIEGEKLLVEVEVRVESALGDQTTRENLAVPPRMAGLAVRQGEVVRREVLAALRRSQRLKADIFGFGDAFHRRYPGMWPELAARWEGLYPTLQVEVRVNSQVKDVGAIAAPLYQKR